MHGSVYVCASVYRYGRNHHTLGGTRHIVSLHVTVLIHFDEY